MVAVSHLVSPATLPSPANTAAQLSVLSYNVLLPNSVDAWWNYKMYSPPLSPNQQHIASWEYRQALLKDRIQTINADVVCLQEVSPTSFQSDFCFMQELGYDGMELFKRGRFRPATFWKTSRVEISAPPVHKDRTLLTAFRVRQESKEKVKKNDEKSWYMLNCNLQAGKEGGRRVRQVHEGVRAVMTLARKLKEEPDPVSTVRLVVCGDFNGGPECGAVRYLEDGAVDETFREDGEPVSSNKKSMPLTLPLIDVATTVTSREPPPTMVVHELIQQMVKEGTIDTPEISDAMSERLERIYARYATHNGQMNLADVKRWLTTINGQVGRGSEFREAAKQMGWTPPENGDELSQSERKALVQLPPDGILTLDGFRNVYLDELRQGKFWGIAYDLAILGEPLSDIGLYTARYDRMYCSTALQPTAVLDTLCDVPCPNEFEPSDHLPVAATFSAVNN